jgi:soluble lytic murein transglycosylase-like protein
MKYLIAVLLSVLFCALIRPTPALTKTAVHNAKAVETTTKAVTPAKAVQPQPEKVQEAVARSKPVPIKPQKRYAYGCQRYDYLFRQYDWNVDVAEAICQAESGGNPYAYSSTCDRGLMQVNCIHSDMVGYDLSSLYSPTTNIRVAHKIYSAHGWTAWSTFKNHQYLAFL